jgi:hypothetical protein
MNYDNKNGWDWAMYNVQPGTKLRMCCTTLKDALHHFWSCHGKLTKETAYSYFIVQAKNGIVIQTFTLKDAERVMKLSHL